MTKLAVSVLAQSLEQALAAAAVAAEQGADLVEFRIDSLTRPAAALTELVQRSALPCIVTCRHVSEGGQFDGPEELRLEALEAACAGARAPAYLDVELAAYQRSAMVRQRVNALVDHPGQVRPTSTGLILSTHDFTGRPADLYQRLEAMVAAAACRAVKLVWTARSLRDNLEALELIAQRHKPTIALCMGEAGLPSRVLARKFGGLVTFAALDERSATAPGQPTLAQAKGLYRWDRLGSATGVFGVIGWPVGHSMSPAIHNAGFDATGFDGVYLPMPIPPEYEHFKATVGAWLDCPPLHFRGASVTIPHKENLLRFVRERGGEIEPLAQAIGAANTLTVLPDGRLHASNSDYAAALDSVCAALGIGRPGLAGKRVAVLGAGGAARAVVAGFAHCGASVVIYNRTVEKARALAEEFSRGSTGAATTDGVPPGKVAAAPLDRLCDSCCQVVVNCTPVGMHPKVEDTPLPALPSARAAGDAGPLVVFDTIYNPIQTRLLREAAAAGCLTVSGVEMFVRQAATQFERWTGQAAPLEVFRQVLLERLGAGRR